MPTAATDIMYIILSRRNAAGETLMSHTNVMAPMTRHVTNSPAPSSPPSAMSFADDLSAAKAENKSAAPLPSASSVTPYVSVYSTIQQTATFSLSPVYDNIQYIFTKIFSVYL